MGGGAWKVAYADFVTAMMALFMVLWISAQDEEIIFKTVQYFKDPFGIGFSDASRGSLNDNNDSAGESITLKQREEQKMSMVDLAFLHKMANEFYKKLNVPEQSDGGLENKKKVNVTVTPDGLRITLFNDSKDPLFKQNTSEFTQYGFYIMQNLAWLIDRNTMQIRIDSHTPAGFLTEDPDYGPWELTVDRSNAARRLLESFAISPDKIHQVSGFADTQPLPNIAPDMPENQRLEISLVFE